MSRLLEKQHILAIMRRVGYLDKVEKAEVLLPDVVDVDRDGALFAALGIDPDVDALMDRLGGSP